MDIGSNEQQILSRLKDFQRQTVERVHSLFIKGHSRVLVADEVGLGKTLIAKGVIAKLARHHQSELNDELFKVVYICSSQTIVGQNLVKLKINETDRIEDVADTRLSMQHLRAFENSAKAKQLGYAIQLIPLTPGTSFSMTGGGGSVQERALLFAILRHCQSLQPYLEELEIMMEDAAYSSWSNWARDKYEQRVQACNEASGRTYLPIMLEQVDRFFATHEGILQDLIEFLLRIRHDPDASGANSIIHKLRRMMAEISVGQLKADLVIMDEFQRFQELININADNETAILAKRFLGSEAAQKDEKVKVLLLSATPYTLYSTLEEMNESQQDEHYREFMQVIDFLFEYHKDLSTEFREVWSDYSTSLHELENANLTILSAKKKKAEDALYQGICRTERMSVSGADKFLETTRGTEGLDITHGDILSFIQADTLLQEIGLTENMPVDYVKSAPFLLSFMEHYKLKEKITGYFRKHTDQLSLANKPALWVQESKIAAYEELPDNNARFTRLKQETLPANAEKLMWIPPSRPYYEAGGPYTGMDYFTKALVFSSWEMVPRAIASLLSYEAERLTVGKLVKRSTKPNGEKNRSYFTQKNKTRFPAPRLKFNLREGTPAAMTLFSLMYPSVTLAKLYSPIESMNAGMSRVEIEAMLSEKIDALLDGLVHTLKRDEVGGHDDKWYSLAPLLLDRNEQVTRDWLQQSEYVRSFGDSNGDDEDQEDSSSMGKHFDVLREVLDVDHLELGARPHDLTDVLVRMAIASPAVCAMRLFGTEVPASPALSARLAKTILDRFNMQEATSFVELCYGSDHPHWQGVLRYCVDGNLQSVLDEYAHILCEENGWSDESREVRAENICKRMNAAFQTRTASYTVDTYRSFRDRLTKGEKTKFIRMRSSYAAGFYDVTATDANLQRKDQLRLAFNSPFRPFVLATTSIGQEGLDFHFYCRKIVHWNLPSNPVQLEQREGRINRYKCLAIRQNIAHKYGKIHVRDDLWNEMFERASVEEKHHTQPELVPFWCLPEDAPIKIERIVPMYPLSRDQAKYTRLIKILSLYRLSLGQPRQEELLEYVLQNELSEEQLKELFINLSPFYKEQEISAIT